MDPQTIWFFTLLLSGLFLIGAEIFVPGGILGVAGGLALIGSMVMSFIAFESPWNLLIALGIIILSAAFLYLWIRFFPKTRIGKSLTLNDDGAGFHGTDDREDLVGETGSAVTDLRPGGIAMINNQRVDVMADGNWIDRESRIQVIEVEGNVITVQRIEQDLE